MAERYDAVIIGGGHNGLTTAAYLAKAGWRTLVLEKRPILGGATTSAEIVPGYTFSVLSYVVSLLRPEIIRELELPKHGLEILPLDGTFTPVPGDYLWRRDDHAATLREIRRWSRSDADAYEEYGQLMAEMARFIKPILGIVPPDPASIDPRDWLGVMGLARDFARLPERQQAAFIGLMTMSAADFLDQWFETQPLKATMSASGIIGTYLGVRSPGTAYVLLHHYMGEIDGAFRAWGLHKGGTGAISYAIANAARALGAEIRTDAGVAQVRLSSSGDRATGVILDDGEEIEAGVVVSSADVRRTFLQLLEPGVLPGDFEAAVRRFKFRGSSGKVNLALDALPSFTTNPGGTEYLRGAMSISPDVDYMERAYDDAKYGRFSRRPYVDIVIPSLVDPSVAPPGKHVMSCFVQYAPYNLAEGPADWENQREAFGETVIDTISEFAPNLRDVIVEKHVVTPWDMEREWGLTEGNIFHGELSLEQLFFSRPVPGWSRYRTPIQDYWMAGSSTHPGGGIMAANGRLAALELLKAKKGAGGVMAAIPQPSGGRSAAAYDAIVVGGGHNGLVAAAYLAKAGLRTLLLEKRATLGGTVETRRLDDGSRAPGLFHTVGRLRPAVLRELDLGSHGLSLVAPEVRAFAPQPDGRAVTLWADNDRTAADLERWSGADALAWAGFDRQVRALAGFLAALAEQTPPATSGPGLGDAITGLLLGRAYKKLSKDDARNLLRVLPMAVADFVGEWLETDAVRATVAARAVGFTAMGPWSMGTTATLLADSAGNDGGAAGQAVFARGGPGALSDALAAAARAFGAELRTGAQVAAVTSEDGQVTGVALASGEEIAAGTVASGLDPRRTLLDLLGPLDLGPNLRWRAGNIRQPGAVAKVNLALAALPRFPAAGADDDAAKRIRGRILVGATGIDDVERAFDAAKHGRVSDRLVLEATLPTLVDPSLAAREGGHVMSVVAQYVPYGLRDGAWDDAARTALGERVVAALEEVAPGIGALVTAGEVLTPADLEAEYGLSGGHPYHQEPGLDAWFAWRPLVGWARYRMPVGGLYLVGPGAHPGGGVTGAPAHNAVKEILADRRRRR